MSFVARDHWFAHKTQGPESMDSNFFYSHGLCLSNFSLNRFIFPTQVMLAVSQKRPITYSLCSDKQLLQNSKSCLENRLGKWIWTPPFFLACYLPLAVQHCCFCREKTDVIKQNPLFSSLFPALSQQTWLYVKPASERKKKEKLAILSCSFFHKILQYFMPL